MGGGLDGRGERMVADVGGNDCAGIDSIYPYGMVSWESTGRALERRNGQSRGGNHETGVETTRKSRKRERGPCRMSPVKWIEGKC